MWTHFEIKQPFRGGVSLINIAIFFFLNTACKHRLMYAKLKWFVFVFIVNCQFFPNNSVRVCPIKLKIDMLHHMNNAFVPLRQCIIHLYLIACLIECSMPPLSYHHLGFVATHGRRCMMYDCILLTSMN